MPRPGWNVTKQELIDAFKKYSTARKVAKHFDVHYQTVLKYCRMYEIKILPGPKHSSPKRSSFGKWLANNSSTRLPRSIKELAKLSGCSRDTVRNYLWRQRQKSKELLKLKLWKKNPEVVVWTDIKGYKYPDIAFKYVQASVGSSGLIKFVVRLADGSVRVFKYTRDELVKLYGGIDETTKKRKSSPMDSENIT